LRREREGRYTGDGKDKSNERERQREREREFGVDHVALGPRFAFVGAGGGVSVLGGSRAT